MILSSYLWGLRISTIVMAFTFCAVIFFVNPYDFGTLAYVFFYTALFFFITSITTLILTRLWYFFIKDEITSTELRIAARQGILLGLLTCILVFLQQLRVLIWWDMIIVVIAIFLIELQLLLRGFR